MHLIAWATAVWPELNYEQPVAAQINYRYTSLRLLKFQRTIDYLTQTTIEHTTCRCLPAFSSLVWECMPILGPRLEIADRLTFCEVSHSCCTPSSCLMACCASTFVAIQFQPWLLFHANPHLRTAFFSVARFY
jgi:hypothetical protein